jgi:hypothetical protein
MKVLTESEALELLISPNPSGISFKKIIWVAIIWE